MKQKYQLRTKHKSQLLYAMMRALAGEDSRISFEGRLSNTDLVKIDGVHFEETQVLRRGTLQPQLDFLVLPLTPASLPTIEKAIHSKIAFSGSAGIIHVQIEKHGEIAFSAHDNFHEDCVVAYPAASESLLKELVEKRVLYSFEAGQLA
jgi:hypothetical protein